MPRAFIAMILLSMTGCTTTQTSTDSSLIARAYMQAIGTGDADTAWHLLHPSVHKNLSRAEFSQQIASLSEKDKAFWQHWSREIKPQSSTQTWKRGTHAIRITHNAKGQWKIVDSGLDTTTEMSPKLALVQFRQWILARNYSGILEMAPKAEQETLTAEAIEAGLTVPGVTEELIATLNSLIQSNNVRETGPNRWTIEAGRHMAILVLEDGHWRVDDIR